MKKWQNAFPGYGQGISDRIAYYQKMGIAMFGIKENILRHMQNQGMDISSWEESIETGNGNVFKYKDITIVIPTSDVYTDLHEYPHFTISGKLGLIDMINIQHEVQFHIMIIDWKNKTFTNGYWHTIRECLNLEDTCLLYEYLEDRMEDLVILPPEKRDAYNSTGALGVKES